MKLDPNTLKFQAQLILTFELDSQISTWLSTLTDCHKVAIEIKFNAKHIQVTNIFELNGTEKIRKFTFNEDQ